jgi:dTDP-4-amino-4,6-dideoxygalactose transaminase
MRNFGITGFSTVESVGINGKLNEVSAGVGLTSLEMISDRMQHNQVLQVTYREQLDDCSGISVLPITADGGGNGQYAVLLLDPANFGMNRDHLLQVLRAEGIFARSYFVPGCHRSMPYASSQAHTPVPLLATESILDSILQLPVGPSVSVSSTQRFCQLLKRISSRANQIADRIRSGIPVFSHINDQTVAPSPLPLAS